MQRSVAHSLLGILSLRAMSGYDIRKFVRENIGYIWKESYGQIYPMLKRMAAEGLVDVRVERNSGKPDRQVYSLTRAGHSELERWLGRPPERASSQALLWPPGQITGHGPPCQGISPPPRRAVATIFPCREMAES